MNKFLADAISYSNAFLAWIIIIGSSIAGYYINETYFGLFVGILVGLFAAIIFCGLLALIIDIRNNLQEIAKKEQQEE